MFFGLNKAAVQAVDTSVAETVSANPGSLTREHNSLHDYYQQGERWETQIYRRAVVSSKIAWMVASVSMLTSLALAGGYVFLLPLQKYEPYVVTVDKSTGYLEIARALKPGDLADDEAVTQANIVRYIIARETYDYNGLGKDYLLTTLLSKGKAKDDYEAQYSDANPDAPQKQFGRQTRINVEIKSVSLLNERTGQVEFSTIRRNDQQVTRADFVSIVRFEYNRGEMRNEWRFDNPLGFQVFEYRRDQRTITKNEITGETK